MGEPINVLVRVGLSFRKQDDPERNLPDKFDVVEEGITPNLFSGALADSCHSPGEFSVRGRTVPRHQRQQLETAQLQLYLKRFAGVAAVPQIKTDRTLHRHKSTRPGSWTGMDEVSCEYRTLGQNQDRLGS